MSAAAFAAPLPIFPTSSRRVCWWVTAVVPSTMSTCATINANPRCPPKSARGQRSSHTLLAWRVPWAAPTLGLSTRPLGAMTTAKMAVNFEHCSRLRIGRRSQRMLSVHRLFRGYIINYSLFIKCNVDHFLLNFLDQNMSFYCDIANWVDRPIPPQILFVTSHGGHFDVRKLLSLLPRAIVFNTSNGFSICGEDGWIVDIRLDGTTEIKWPSSYSMILYHDNYLPVN